MADESNASALATASAGQVESWLTAASHAQLLSFAEQLGLSCDSPELSLDESLCKTECFRILSVYPRYARAAHASVLWDEVAGGGDNPWADLLPPRPPTGQGTIEFDVEYDIELSGSILPPEGFRTVAGGRGGRSASPVGRPGHVAGGAPAPHTPHDNAALAAELQALRTSVKDFEARFARLPPAPVQADLERAAADAARQAHEDFVSKSNRGLLDAPLLPVTLSARMQHKATAFELHPSFSVHGWERGVDFVDNCMDSPPSQGMLRANLFDCEMRSDDRARLLRGGGKPSTWSDAPLLSLQDKDLLGTELAKADETKRLRQNALLKQVLPVMRSLDSLAHAEQAVHERNASGLAEHLAEIKSQLSDAFHLLAYDLSDLQRQRTDSLFRRMSSASVGVDTPFEETEWSLLPETRVSLEDDLVKKAATARSLRKDLKTLAASRQRARQDFRQGSGSDGGGRQGRKRKRNRKRHRGDSRASDGAQGGDSGTKDKDKQTPPSQGRGKEGGGRGRGRGRGRGGDK